MKKQFYEIDSFLQFNQVGQFSELQTKLNKKRFTLRQLGVTHRALILWDKEGLLYSTSEKGKWRRFDFFELVWIKLISKLRDFNIPIKTIRKLKENILIHPPLTDPAFFDMIIENALHYAPAERKAEARRIVSNKEQIIKELSSVLIPILFLYIMDVILLKSHFAILVNLEGDFFPFKEFYIEEYQGFQDFQEFIHKSHVSVSLSEIVVDFLIDEDLELTQNKLAILTENEAQIINTIRKEKLIYLKIRFNKENDIDLIEATKSQNVSKEARLIDLIMTNGYQDIEIKTENGVIVNCINTRKEKLQK